MRAVCALLIAAAVCPSTATAQTAFEPSPVVDRWWRTTLGAEELSAITSDGAEVQRFRSMPYLLSALSVELIRRNEQSSLTIRYIGNSRTVPIDNATWGRLATLADRNLRVASDRDLRKAMRRTRDVECHGTSAFIEHHSARRTDRIRAFSCDGKIAGPALAYVEALAGAAIDAMVECDTITESQSKIVQLTQCTDKLGWRATPEYLTTFIHNPYPTEQTK